ncbi:nucleotidyltransferase domain-containing protein [Candidatus Woesearchaeota archaeon]|nr:nucleotidyltransferase domain-containing protein [Candidatus Woesearchaeota archaeon]
MFKELKTLKPFFEEPNKEFNVREVSRLLKIAPATASKELKSLSKIGILKDRKERMLNLYKSNLENSLYKDLKIFYSIRKIKESGLVDSLNNFYLRPTIILFGSSAYGTDTETSDLDIVILSEKTKDFSETNKFEKKLNKKIQFFILKDIKDLRNDHLINNVINGIIIQGKVKWI